MLTGSNGFACADVRSMIRTDDDAMVYLPGAAMERPLDGLGGEWLPFEEGYPGSRRSRSGGVGLDRIRPGSGGALR
jgi:hypothetical protein